MVLNKNDLKKYSVVVEDGSGCLFQSMTDEYTYILTAKHIFFKKVEDGRPEKIQLSNGTSIQIKQCVEIGGSWQEKKIEFILIEGETYFPHKGADIAILKISPAIEGFDRICTSNKDTIEEETFLCGYPQTFRANNEGEKHTEYKVEHFGSADNGTRKAQLDTALNQETIEGMSGGAILSIDNNHINIMGIQSKMASSSGYQAGQVAFVPISLFNDIIEYDEYKSILTPLIPNYLKSFQFVKDNIFKLEQGLLTKDISTKLMKILNTKATSLISSDITPYKIKRHLVEELKLISDYQYKRYNNPKFWSKWLELLTVINIVELQPFGGSTPLTADKIQIILENIRLFYSDSDECFWLKNIDNLHKMNYNGLAENSTIIVASNVKAADMHILDNTLIVGNIARVRDEFDLDKISGKIDSATDFPLEKYKFVNISAFKEGTVDKLGTSFKDDGISNCISQLKTIYEEILKNG